MSGKRGRGRDRDKEKEQYDPLDNSPMLADLHWIYHHMFV